MVHFVYSSETASSNIAGSLKDLLGMKELEPLNGLQCFGFEKIKMLKVNGSLINSDFLDGKVDDLIIFLSRHSSSKEIPAFTVHAEGNWTEDNGLGGRAKELSVSSPLSMLNVLSAINKINDTNITLTYEATHHGPFLNKRSFFVELGGNQETIINKEFAKMISKAVMNSLETEAEYDKIAVGIGGLHYSEKFTKLALNGKYAFAHIMSKYYVGNIDMIEQAFQRSDKRPEIAVIEWKSIKAVDRENILRELNKLGIDYAKV